MEKVIATANNRQSITLVKEIGVRNFRVSGNIYEIGTTGETFWKTV